MVDTNWNILSDDKSSNIIQIFTQVTNVALDSRMNMWGETMWGAANGGAYSNTYQSGQFNVKGDVARYNVVKV